MDKAPAVAGDEWNERIRGPGSKSPKAHLQQRAAGQVIAIGLSQRGAPFASIKATSYRDHGVKAEGELNDGGERRRRHLRRPHQHQPFQAQGVDVGARATDQKPGKLRRLELTARRNRCRSEGRRIDV